jgi:tetratricopeptide (TPR) repeat protein
LSLKEKGNSFFKKKEFFSAIKFYRKALEQEIADEKLKLALLNNIAQSYIEIEMFEDSLEFCD